MQISRRRLLSSLGAMGALTALGSRRARAGGLSAPNNLIIVLAGGGWDTTYTFDPKPDSDLVDTGIGDYTLFGDGAIWTHADRPSVATFFERYGAISSVVNGINIPSVAHNSCTQRILSGSRDRDRPDIGAIIGHEIGDAVPMPYLDISGQARPGTLGADMGYMGQSNQLGGLLFREEALKPADRSTWQRHWEGDAERELVRSYIEGRAGGFGDRAALGENQRRAASFLTGLDRGHQLLEHESFFTAVPRGRGFEDQAIVAVNALLEGVSQTVLLSGDGSFDTHQDNFEQIELYENTFAGVLALMQTLEDTPGRVSGRMLDETVVLVLSEMGRTPRLNDNDGKDHWPFTSCIVAGAGIAGDQIVGATDDSLAALPIDMLTGLPDDLGEQLQSENLHAALLELFGIDPELYFPGMTPLRALHA